MVTLRWLSSKGYVCYAVANACDEREETRDGDGERAVSVWREGFVE